MAPNTRGHALPGKLIPTPRKGNKGTVFIVEDHEDTRAGLRDALEGDGFQVYATGDGSEALARLRSAPTPDALLLDLNMPGVNGFEMYRALRDDPHLATIPVIVVTAAPPGRRVGLDVAATIRKPLDVQELLYTVRGAIARGGSTPRQGP